MIFKKIILVDYINFRKCYTCFSRKIYFAELIAYDEPKPFDRLRF
jgi:hypothetical protein